MFINVIQCLHIQKEDYECDKSVGLLELKYHNQKSFTSNRMNGVGGKHETL